MRHCFEISSLTLHIQFESIDEFIPNKLKTSKFYVYWAQKLSKSIKNYLHDSFTFSNDERKCQVIWSSFRNFELYLRRLNYILSNYLFNKLLFTLWTCKQLHYNYCCDRKRLLETPNNSLNRYLHCRLQVIPADTWVH